MRCARSAWSRSTPTERSRSMESEKPINVLWGLRTNFSIGESILTAKVAVDRAKELGFTHIALADTMTVAGVIDLTTRAKKAGLEVIPGARLRVRLDNGSYFGPAVYCRDEDAFKALM